VHHSCIALAAIYVLFIMPPEDPLMSILVSPSAKNLDYYPITSIAGMFTLAYMIFDFIGIAFWVEDRSPLGKQMYFHHFAITLITLNAIFAGEHFIKHVIAGLLCETSGISLNLRDIVGKKNWTGITNTINTAFFAIAFTLTRVFLFPMIIYSHLKLRNFYDYADHSAFHHYAFWANLIFFSAIYLLNLFWF
jgi:hypothetical protein